MRRPKYVDRIGIRRDSKGETVWVKVQLPHGGEWDGRKFLPGQSVEIKLGRKSSISWEEATLRRDELQSRADKGLGLENQPAPIFKTWAYDWLDRNRGTMKRLGTAEVHLGVHLVPEFGAARLDHITPAAIERWIAQKRMEGLSPDEIVRMVQTLRLILYDTKLLHNHPAVIAWMNLTQMLAKVDEIQVLKIEKNSKAFRVKGLVSGNATIIAKRSRRIVATNERTIYENILPRLQVSHLRYFGFAEEPDGKFCWQFLEDAGEVEYLHNEGQHRALSAKWLGLMHTSAARVIKMPMLPDRGTNWFLKVLRSNRSNLRNNLANLALKADDVEILKIAILYCDILELRWNEIERSCAEVPSTLVHTDFVPKNLRIRDTPTGIVLLPFDWSLAGWGPPAHDIAMVDPDIYYSVVKGHWQSLDLLKIQRLAAGGRIFRWLTAIKWASRLLEREWGIRKLVHTIRVYQSPMAREIERMREMDATSLFYGDQSFQW
jgi:hypothetical protein